MINVFLAATLALTAFAGNSVLCRMALAEQTIDAASFTAIRLLSGVIILIPLAFYFSRRSTPLPESYTKNFSSHVSKRSNLLPWFSAAMLFIYAATFSYAYILLDTGIGALILFATVQIVMMLVSLCRGRRFHWLEWLGLIIAFIGFVYLVAPELTQPSAIGFLLMVISGVAWGIYTLMGAVSSNPLQETAFNFLRALPFLSLLLIIIFLNGHMLVQVSVKGAVLAIFSGAVTSGLGYTFWYIALTKLTTTQAAVSQLLVPIIAAIGGVIFIDETITVRLLISAFLVLGGVLIVTIKKQ